MGKRKTTPSFVLAALLLSAALLGACSRREVPLTQTPAPTQAPAATPSPAVMYTVDFLLDGEVLASQSVAEGGYPAAVAVPQGDAAFLGWQDESGAAADPFSAAVTGDAVYTASLAPALDRDCLYLEAEGGLFRPDDALTRREAAGMLYTLLADKPALPDPLPQEEAYHAERIPDKAHSVTGLSATALEHEVRAGEPQENPRQRSYAQLAALCQAGYMPYGEDDALLPDEAMEREALLEVLKGFFPSQEVEEAAAEVADGPVSRLDTARIMNALLGRSVPADNADALYPDVPEEAEYLDVIRAASAGTEAEPGRLLLSNGQLYWIGEDGFCLRDEEVGRLYFGPDGRYTSGSEELDDLVESAVAALVNVNDVHEDQLRSLYDYVRDNFVYLRRNYYDVGEHGWEVEEATEFLDSHYGNCYSFAAGLWALARGIGYDANAISGLQGENQAPHGWIDITLEDGVRYFFDVEAEYAALRDGASLFPMFKLPWSSSTVTWEYTYDWDIEGFPNYG